MMPESFGNRGWMVLIERRSHSTLIAHEINSGHCLNYKRLFLLKTEKSSIAVGESEEICGSNACCERGHKQCFIFVYILLFFIISNLYATQHW